MRTTRELRTTRAKDRANLCKDNFASDPTAPVSQKEKVSANVVLIEIGVLHN